MLVHLVFRVEAFTGLVSQEFGRSRFTITRSRANNRADRKRGQGDFRSRAQETSVPLRKVSCYCQCGRRPPTPLGENSARPPVSLRIEDRRTPTKAIYQMASRIRHANGVVGGANHHGASPRSHPSWACVTLGWTTPSCLPLEKAETSSSCTTAKHTPIAVFVPTGPHSIHQAPAVHHGRFALAVSTGEGSRYPMSARAGRARSLRRLTDAGRAARADVGSRQIPAGV